MSTEYAGLDPVWDSTDRMLGQLFMHGFEGQTVTPQIRSLIRDHHIGSILLTAKNLKCQAFTLLSPVCDANIRKLPIKRPNSFWNCNSAPTMPGTPYRSRSGSTRRTGVSTASSMRS